MPVSIDWVTKIISVPQDYLTSLGGGLYELDIDVFRLDLKDIEDSEEGVTFPDTHRHNTEVTLAGATYARTIEIINGYTVEFEEQTSAYTVVCVGANHNIGDVKVVNSVSLIIGNSAGLIVVSGSEGGGLTVPEHDKLMALPSASDVATAVWGATVRTLSTFGALITDIWGNSVRTLTQAVGLTTGEHDHLMALSNTDLTALTLATNQILGLSGQNIRWSAIVHNAGHLLTSARITQYTDATLVTPSRAWDISATYDVDGEITSYQMVLV